MLLHPWIHVTWTPDGAPKTACGFTLGVPYSDRYGGGLPLRLAVMCTFDHAHKVSMNRKGQKVPHLQLSLQPLCCAPDLLCRSRCSRFAVSAALKDKETVQ